MYHNRIVEQVVRTPRPMTRVLRAGMAVSAVILLLSGIVLSRGFMLTSFLFAVLHYVYGICSKKEYEYILEGHTFAIDVIWGGKYRRPAHVLNMEMMEVLAPNWHDSVAMYRKNGGSIKLSKYDYTSYEENTPFYTMIITENHKKIKLLLDLSEDMLREIQKKYPDRVYLQHEHTVQKK